MDKLETSVICINKFRSLTKAAKELGVTQPALSAGLNSVEKKLGFCIFDRKKTPIELTAEGEVYLEYLKAKDVLEHNLYGRIRDLRQERDQTIVIGAPATYVETVLVGAVDEFLKQYPEYHIRILESTIPELLDKTTHGDVNLFISTSNTLPEGFETECLASEKIYLCVPINNPINDSLNNLRTGLGEETDSFPFELLTGEKFITLAPNQPLQMETDRYCEAHDLIFHSCIEVDQVTTAVRLARHGLGICFSSEGVLKNLPDIGGLRVYPVPRDMFQRKIYVAYSKENYLSAGCKKLIEILKKETGGEKL